jgi:hypothetical protein
LIAGMARSYKWLTQKVGCIEGARINQHAVFRIIIMRNFGR